MHQSAPRSKRPALRARAARAGAALTAAWRRWQQPRLDEAFVQRALESPPSAAPRYPQPTLDTAALQCVDALLAGRVPVGDGVVALESLSWRAEPFGSGPSRERFYFHSLDWVRQLLETHRATGDARCLDLARGLADRWISECLDATSPESLWDDHVTALRGIILAQLWSALAALPLTEVSARRRLLLALVRHGDLLAKEWFHRRRHNHGITQAYALFGIGLLLPGYRDATRWVDLARRRLEQHAREDVSAEGMHREHSPSYHFAVLRHFLYAAQLGRAYDVAFSTDFSACIARMLPAGCWLLKPDATLAAMGDTWRTSAFLLEDRDLDEWPAETRGAYRALTSDGGGVPQTASAIFPGGGYAVMRGAQPRARTAREAAYVIARLATFQTTHVHRDVFSFELYAHGADLIVDSGGPYSYRHAMRKHFVSTAAHNTIVVDDADQAVGESTIVRWSSDSACTFLEAVHTLYSGVTHRRAFLFFSGNLLILDQLESATPHRYTQLFHLAPQLDVVLDGHRVAARPATAGTSVRIVPLAAADMTVHLHRGADAPPRGWLCAGDHVMIPTPAVAYERAGTSTSFAVLLVPQPAAVEHDVACSASGDWRVDALQLQMVIGPRITDIRIPATGPPAVVTHGNIPHGAD